MYIHRVRSFDHPWTVNRQDQAGERHVLLTIIIWALLGIMLSLVTSELYPDAFAAELGVSLSWVLSVGLDIPRAQADQLQRRR